MKLFSESLLVEIQKELEVIHQQSNNPIAYAPQAIKVVGAALEKLKTQSVKYRFKSKAEEIEFFKVIKPQFVSKVLFYQEVYTIELNKPIGAKKGIRKYYKAHLTKLNAFFKENLWLYQYYRTGNTSFDNQYFLRGQNNGLQTLDRYFDSSFSTTHDHTIASILANDLLIQHLEREIEKLKTKEIMHPSKQGKRQTWTGSKVGLVELIYALHTEGVFNHGSSDLKEVSSFFEKAFAVNLGQYHRTFIEIRSRKSERTKFLTTLREKLIYRMDKADE